MAVSAQDFRMFTDWIAEQSPLAGDPRKRLQLHHAISATLIWDADAPAALQAAISPAPPYVYMGNLYYTPGWEGTDRSNQTRLIVIPATLQGSLVSVSGPIGFMVLTLTLSSPVQSVIHGQGLFGYDDSSGERSSNIENLGPPNPALSTTIRYHIREVFDADPGESGSADHWDLLLSCDYSIRRVPLT